MTDGDIAARSAEPPTVPHEPRLFVAWQDPETRAIEPVAVLTQFKSPSRPAQYKFSYLRRVTSLAGFEPFSAFPELGTDYISEQLFPFFANRVLARKRSDYEATMKLLDLQVEAEPFEVLARSGGRRETDRLEVFPEPVPDGNGLATCMFFVRGLRYFSGSAEAAEELKTHEELRMLDDLQNPVNSGAIILAKREDSDLRLLGYIPDYLASHAQTVVERCGPANVRVTVEHVNPRDTPRHMRVLCRITSCWPPGYAPFADEAFRPMSEPPTPSLR